jgi:hypothetical protein
MAVADGPGAHRSENGAVTILRIRIPFLRTYGGKGRIRVEPLGTGKL